MKYDWENIKARCKQYVTTCVNDLPEGFADRLINDVYNHLLIDEKKNARVDSKIDSL